MPLVFVMTELIAHNDVPAKGRATRQLTLTQLCVSLSGTVHGLERCWSDVAEASEWSAVRWCRASERGDTEKERECVGADGALYSASRRKDGVCSGSAEAEREREREDIEMAVVGTAGRKRRRRRRGKGQRRDIEVSWPGMDG